MLTDQTILIINYLVYPVIYSPTPMKSIKWVIETTVDSNPPLCTKAQTIKAIDEAVSTNGWLNEIASRGRHSESDIKSFLSAIKAELSK